ncbi:hypothetical protein CC79DRAFT_824936 [Sarocladium strictum]
MMSSYRTNKGIVSANNRREKFIYPRWDVLRKLWLQPRHQRRKATSGSPFQFPTPFRRLAPFQPLTPFQDLAQQAHGRGHRPWVVLALRFRCLRCVLLHRGSLRRVSGRELPRRGSDHGLARRTRGRDRGALRRLDLDPSSPATFELRHLLGGTPSRRCCSSPTA